jgi:hypothetical protein
LLGSGGRQAFQILLLPAAAPLIHGHGVVAVDAGMPPIARPSDPPRHQPRPRL